MLFHNITCFLKFFLLFVCACLVFFFLAFSFYVILACYLVSYIFMLFKNKGKERETQQKMKRNTKGRKADKIKTERKRVKRVLRNTEVFLLLTKPNKKNKQKEIRRVQGQLRWPEEKEKPQTNKNKKYPPKN